jgi:hypothetical protein
MSETDNDYRVLVEQKRQARTERNARLRVAEQEAQEREASEAQAAQMRAEQDRQALAELARQREAAAEARRNRPVLIAKYKADPSGIRHVETLKQVCIHCGSERVREKSASAPHVLICTECWAEWYVNRCWSCQTGWLDSRDPETPACEVCGRTKCAVCGACNRNGCSTNPYSAAHRHRDVETV